MSKQLFNGIAFIANAIATAAAHVATNYDGETALPVAPAAVEGEAPKPKRGRPAGSTNAAPATPEPETHENTKAPEKPAGFTLDELKALVKPVVENGDASTKEAVKKVIASFGVGNLSELATRPEHHAAFAEALTKVGVKPSSDDL